MDEELSMIAGCGELHWPRSNAGVSLGRAEGGGEGGRAPAQRAPLDDVVREELGAWARGRSELTGFCISGHFAGGFERLEQAGWHRATIFRKVHQFRAIFREYSDTYRFGWIRLDLRRGWTEQVRQALVSVGGRPDHR
jgi:hypothetical protein